MWLEILKKEVASKGPKQVAKELGVSRSTVDLVCQDKYPASTEKIADRVRRIYGENGHIKCPGTDGDFISADLCSDRWNKAKKIGMMASNPETLMLYKTCIKCFIRR